MKILTFFVVYCCLSDETKSSRTQNITTVGDTHSTIAITTGTIKSRTTTPRPRPKPTTVNPTLHCDTIHTNLNVTSCREKDGFIECDKPSGYINATITPHLSMSDNDFIVFNAPSHGEIYNITLCFSVDKCQKYIYETLEIDPYIDKNILNGVIMTQNNATLNCTSYENRMTKATYVFKMSSLDFNSNSTVTENISSENCFISFSNLERASLYKLSVYGISKHNKSTSTVSRILVPEPNLAIGGDCKSSLFEIKIHVGDNINDQFRKHFETNYSCNMGDGSHCNVEGENIWLENLTADTPYNITLSVTLKEHDTGFKFEGKKNQICHTTLSAPNRVDCDYKPYHEQIDSSVNISLPYEFSNRNGRVVDLKMMVNRNGGVFRGHIDFNVSYLSCEMVTSLLTDLPSGQFDVKLMAKNRNNETSYSNVYTFNVDATPKALIATLVVIILLLLVVIIILVCLLSQCKIGTNRSKKRIQITATSSSFSRFIALKARSVKKLSHRISHHQRIRVPIKISEFPEYVETMEKDSGLLYSEEFDDLKNIGRNQPTEDALLQCNRPKNRFVNILPYDATRIKLLPIEDEEGSDYINANWIPGYDSKREFIATQGPLIATLDDFWRMVWEQNCPAIVMLTLLMEKNKMKCEQYWPSESSTTYGDLQVTLQDEEVSEKWCFRLFELENSKNGEKKSVKHFHYLEWPDMNVPETESLLSFIYFIRDNLHDDGLINDQIRPVVVHCSAGVGRSGTYIALETLFKQLAKGDDINVFDTVKAMRMNRILMVQTEQQYVFLHRCLREIVEKASMSERPTPSSSLLQIHKPGISDRTTGTGEPQPDFTRNPATGNGDLLNEENKLGSSEIRRSPESVRALGNTDNTKERFRKSANGQPRGLSDQANESNIELTPLSQDSSPR